MKYTAYLSPSEELVKTLSKELGAVEKTYGRLLLTKGEKGNALWAQNTWYDVQRISITSVSDAVKKLRAIQRNWVLYSFDNHRRAKLIQSELPHVSAKPLQFPAQIPQAPLGSWTLIDQNTILASPSCSSAFPNGEMQFVEDKVSPPSRAYLKLWEVFTLLQTFPKKSERVLDAGASPGGWSWVLSELGANVFAVDRAELAPSLMKKKNIEFQKGDTFKVLPKTHGEFDWIFCDAACYPDKLFEWVSAWLEAGEVKNFVCTLKFQGTKHYAEIKKFEKVPGSWIGHLYNNKHELTWVRINS